MSQRHIVLEQVRNFRDLGGYETREGAQVRWRSVFRSSSLCGATPADVRQLLDLGVEVVLDLRSTEELKLRGISPLHEHGVEHRHVPYMREGGQRAREVEQAEAGHLVSVERGDLDYSSGIEAGVNAVAEVFRRIASADPSRAVVYNCEAGKDRTGVTSALLLRVLGVPDDTIVEDYVLTRRYITYWRDWTEEDLERRGREYGRALSRAMLDARPETMWSFLGDVDARFGSAEELLAPAGVDGGLIEALRDRLLVR